MNDYTRDPEVQSALNDLPETPQHGSAFWDELNTGLSTQSPMGKDTMRTVQSRPFGRYAGLALAAAATIAVAAVGLTFLGEETTSIDVAGESPATTTVSTTTVSTTTAEPAATTTTEAVSTERPGEPVFTHRAKSTLFHYDVGVPEGWEVVYANGTGVYISTEGSAASLQLQNYFRDGPFPDPGVASNESLIVDRDLTIPLYDNSGDAVTDEGVILAIDEFVYSGGFAENRIVRTYVFNDRTINAELIYKDGDLTDAMALQMMDDIRMFNAALSPLETCSTSNRDPLGTPADLNGAQQATFVAIMDALVACDWDRIEALTGPSFTASFGGETALELWQGQERFGEPILATIYDHFAAVPAVGSETASWPRAFTAQWDEVTPEMLNELRSLGYTEADFDGYTEFGGYVGYRAVIQDDGTWAAFVAGD